jgi:hypothetical protein
MPGFNESVGGPLMWVQVDSLVDLVLRPALDPDRIARCLSR